jgi:hypothetical protein
MYVFSNMSDYSSCSLVTHLHLLQDAIQLDNWRSTVDESIWKQRWVYEHHPV